MRRRGAASFISVVVPVALAVVAVPSSEAHAATLGCAVERVAAVGQAAGEDAGLLAARARGLPVVETPGGSMVAVILEPVDGDARSVDAAEVEALGGVVDASSTTLVRALVPVTSLASCASLTTVATVRSPVPATAAATGLGSTVSESVDAIGADALRDRGVTGRGVAVAVVDLGFIGLGAAIAAGELPDDTVTVDLPGFHDNPLEKTTDHGVAVAEQVMDVAPGAKLYCLMVSDELDLQNATAYLRDNGIRVACHSVSWANSSYYDDTGVVSDAFNASRDTDGVFWAVSAGNAAQRHWRGTWTDADVDDLLEFDTDDELLGLTTGGGTVKIYLNWDQYGAVNTDLDLYIVDANEAVVAFSDDHQALTADPTEKVTFTYDASAAPYAVRVAHFDGPTAGLDITLFCVDGEFEHAVAASSLRDPACAHGVCAVAAIDVADWAEAFPQTEPFSSQGPTTDGRPKPDITAPDGTATWTNDGNASYGTSFSAPVVAGAAALLLEAEPTLTADTLTTQLTSSATDVGDLGVDDVFGAGKIALGSLGSLKTIWYVDVAAAGPTNDGTSWATAFTHPQDAVDVAQGGDDVWVAGGTYQLRTPATDTIVLSLLSGVGVFGGFAGTETKRDDADPATNLTTLDGQDLATHVVVAVSDTRLHGMAITGGNAAGTGDDGAGGAVLVSGVARFDLVGCTVASNAAAERGGGVAIASSSAIELEGCEFALNDVAGGDGGAAAVDSAAVEIRTCSFHDNTASNEGGALWARAIAGLDVDDSTFEDNTAGGNGGAVVVRDGTIYAYVTGGSFARNVAASGDGGAVYVEFARLRVEESTLDANAAGGIGGAVCGSTAWYLGVMDSTVTANQAAAAGAIFVGTCSLVRIEDSTIEDNEATSGDGGAISIDGTSAQVNRCAIARNVSAANGGGVAITDGVPRLFACDVFANVGVLGGGLYVGAAGRPVVVGCVFAGNRASSGGGVYSAGTSGGLIANSTVTGNVAQVAGGGVFIDDAAHTAVSNTILWADAPDEFVDADVSGKVTYCCVEGGCAGIGVVTGDPAFVDPGALDDGGTPADPSDDTFTAGEYRLTAGSSCIDAADGEDAGLLDREDNLRLDDPGVPNTGIGSPSYADIGAYEFTGTTPLTPGGSGGDDGGCAPGRGASSPALLVALAAVCLAMARRCASWDV